MKPKDKHNFLRLYDVHKNYRVISEVGAGTYGRVYKAFSQKTNKYVALKKIDMTRQEMDGFPITAIREIKLLRMLNHKNIISLLEIIMSRPSSSNKYRGSTYLVFEYMDHDFVGLSTIKYRFKLNEIKCIMKQMLDGLKYLHEKKIIHRDMKSANILLNNNGEVKIADFGLARQFSTNPVVYYTNKVVTLWYRAPELLLGSTDYNTQIDIWSLGCIFAELLTGEILFRGDKESRQLELIYEICGTPDKNNWPEAEKLEYYNNMTPKTSSERKIREVIKGKKSDLDEETVNFLDDLLILDPKKRLSAQSALNHQFFQTEPLECNVKEMPVIEKECHDTLLRAKKVRKDDNTNKLRDPENTEKIGLNTNNNHIRSPDQINTNKFFKDYKEKGHFDKFYDDHQKNYFNNRGGFKGPNRSNPYYKKNYNNEGYTKYPNQQNIVKPGVFFKSSGYNNFRKFGGNTIEIKNNNPDFMDIEPKEKKISENNTNKIEEEIKEEAIKQPVDEVKENFRANLPMGGLRSLIQNNQIGLKEENIKEIVKFEEIEKKNDKVSKKIEELLLENKCEIPIVQTQSLQSLPFDKNILNEKRIKKKDPSSIEQISKKVHLE